MEAVDPRARGAYNIHSSAQILCFKEEDMLQLLLPIIYLSFISLGLPDSVLGAAWPSMYEGFAVPVSYAGIISMIISAGTIISSLQSDRVTRRFGTGTVTAVSVLLTALALFGFSLSRSFWLLCALAIPYGLGAGSVDASLNNYVALHYESRHMSWLHCMWGVGAAVGPYIMGFALTGGRGWNAGYRCIAILQILLTAALFISLPLWKKSTAKGEAGEAPGGAPLTLRQIFRLTGAKEAMITFFCYCAIEQTTGLWASSYFALHGGFSAEAAARFASLFYIGITIGRAFSGFLTMRFNDAQMIRLGEGIILLGGILMLLPLGGIVSFLGLILIGLGCAPVYPCMIHSTPQNFGAENSQAVIGVQMAFAYIGILLMPPLFGLLADLATVALLPVFLLALLLLMSAMHERLLRIAARKS